MNTTKAARNKHHAQRTAREAGLESFAFPCAIHGPEALSDTQHGWCIECRAMSQASRAVKETRKAAHVEAYRASHLEQLREVKAAAGWRTATGGNLPASYTSEREALVSFYAAVPEGHHADHLCPKIAKDLRGTHVASGLHARINLVAIPGSLNMRKRSYFDPENFREQRPANAFPGGQWDPELTEQEWARVELLVRRYDADRGTTVRAIQSMIARQAGVQA